MLLEKYFKKPWKESRRHTIFKWIYEPRHDKTPKNECAPSEDSDQPGHPPSLIRVFACAQWVAKGPRFLHADSKNSDQTGRMPKLIWVFAGLCWFCHVVAHMEVLMMQSLKSCIVRILFSSSGQIASTFSSFGAQYRHLLPAKSYVKLLPIVMGCRIWWWSLSDAGALQSSKAS